VTYNAFMSCTHAADGMLAPALQSALHRFAKLGIGCARCISSDKTTLAVTPQSSKNNSLPNQKRCVVSG
jgi:hypothetical protein